MPLVVRIVLSTSFGLYLSEADGPVLHNGFSARPQPEARSPTAHGKKTYGCCFRSDHVHPLPLHGAWPRLEAAPLNLACQRTPRIRKNTHVSTFHAAHFSPWNSERQRELRNGSRQGQGLTSCSKTPFTRLRYPRNILVGSASNSAWRSGFRHDAIIAHSVFSKLEHRGRAAGGSFFNFQYAQ